MLNFNTVPVFEQIPLIHTVNKDDELLLISPDTEWYRTLKYFQWQDYREIAAKYYDALYHFNKSQEKPQSNHRDYEQKDQAAQRLLFSRATMDKTAPVLHPEEYKESFIRTISPLSIAPGITPDRLGGKKPKCFFALFKGFIGVSLMGFAPEPDKVYLLLTSNLSFARVCGFIPKGEDEQYWFKYVPSLRKLEQFDQIMTDYGLWSKSKWNEVRQNIEKGVIKKENELVGDTTHYYAFSGFETLTFKNEKGKEKTKSQSKVTKSCHCDNKEKCQHPWKLTDDGAGTIVKAHNKYIWGHKASILGLPLQGIPLDAIAVADASTFDGKTFLPHVKSLFEHLPEVQPWIDRVLYDSACDSKPLKDKFKKELNVDLKASFNPRRKKAVTVNLPRGMKKVTACGNVVCNADFEMDYRGIRYGAEKFIYRAPVDENDISVCTTCEYKTTCCPTATEGRVVEISFDILPHIDTQEPPMSKRFKAIMIRRPSVERMIKRLKCDLSDDRLKKRGNNSFQAYLDKTMIAFHILLRT